jgi:hypothetical protein
MTLQATVLLLKFGHLLSQMVAVLQSTHTSTGFSHTQSFAKAETV